MIGLELGSLSTPPHTPAVERFELPATESAALHGLPVPRSTQNGGLERDAPAELPDNNEPSQGCETADGDTEPEHPLPEANARR